MRSCVHSEPDVIPAVVSIFHPQLRDLLQPAGEKGKLLFVHRMGIECVDFNQMKGPTHFCTLDFAAVCLTTGAGLVAAGGEHSELDIRPLFPLPNASPSSNPLASADGTAQAVASSSTSLSPSSLERPAIPRWHLRTPTGGSINNSICIQPEPRPISAALRSIVPVAESSTAGHAALAGTSPQGDKLDRSRSQHREKRRREDISEDQEPSAVTAWKRDEPGGRPGELTATEKGHSEQSHSDDGSASKAKSTTERQSETKMLRLLISNNDKSVKAFRLRPPARTRGLHQSSMHNERIESGLPGLSRTQTVKFPTCVNHSSFSPDGRHVVSVGDTPEVFLFSVHPASGELTKIATYTASDDASFSSTWSPDGMQFAVASQDGFVSVWDVRSSKKIASLKTVQFADRYGAGAARVVKWSPRGNVLAFSDQLNWVQIVDTVTFETVQRIRLPYCKSVSASDTACEHPSDTDDSGGEGDGVAGTAADSSVTYSGGRNDTIQGDRLPGLGGEEWLESTSPALYATANRILGNRHRQRASVASLSRPWHSGQRYRDIGYSSGASNTTSDRSRLSEWTTVGRQSALSDDGRLTHDSTNATSADGGDILRSSDVGPATSRMRTYADAVRPQSASEEIDWMQRQRTSHRYVDSILQGLREDAQAVLQEQDQARQRETSTLSPRSWSIWSTRPQEIGGGDRGRTHRGWSLHFDLQIGITGLTWDPDGDYLYVSTTNSILRYTVIDTRSSFAQASIR